MVTLDKVYHAAYVLKSVVRNTDMIFAPELCPGSQVYLKTENLQVTGSFKVRGAYYKISQLSEEEKQKGVIACSAGNHAQGVALGAAAQNIPALICIPDEAPIAKIEATKRYNAEVALVKGTYDEAYDEACRIRDETGRTFIHPFDDPLVIAGQGTIGLEILDQLPDVEAVIVPIGGGGLISGVGFAIKQLKPDCKVYGVQTLGAPSMFNSFKQGKMVCSSDVNTFADGIAVKNPGELTYQMVQKYVDDIVTVTDDEVATAILTLIERQKLICEGAGAVGVAAAIFNKLDIKDKKVCCLLSGGNIDVNILSRVIKRGLLKTGRTANLTIALVDKPGQLKGVSEIIARCGGNVTSVRHNQGEADSAINSCLLRIGMETRDSQQIEEIRRELTKAGFQLVD